MLPAWLADSSLTSAPGIVLILTALGTLVGILTAWIRSRQEAKGGVTSIASQQTDTALKAQGAALVSMQGELVRKDVQIAALQLSVDKLEGDLVKRDATISELRDDLRVAINEISKMKLKIHRLEMKDDLP